MHRQAAKYQEARGCRKGREGAQFVDKIKGLLPRANGLQNQQYQDISHREKEHMGMQLHQRRRMYGKAAHLKKGGNQPADNKAKRRKGQRHP